MMVWPFWANFFKVTSTFAALLLSSPEVGSSSMIKDGLETISIAIQTLFFYPPDIPLMFCPPTNTFSHF